jgi:hypothetical protein
MIVMYALFGISMHGALGGAKPTNENIPGFR